MAMTEHTSPRLTADLLRRTVRMELRTAEEMETVYRFADRLDALWAVLDAAEKLRDTIWQQADCFDPTNGLPGLVDVWNKCTIMSARLDDLHALESEHGT